MAYSGGKVLGDGSLTVIGSICKRYKVEHFYHDGAGLIGVRHDGRIWWHRWITGAYQLTGTTRNPGNATYHKGTRVEV